MGKTLEHPVQTVQTVYEPGLARKKSNCKNTRIKIEETKWVFGDFH